MHEVLVNRLGGLSLPRKSVVRLTDRPDMTLDVYRGHKTTKQQQQPFNVIAQSIYLPLYVILGFVRQTTRWHSISSGGINLEHTGHFIPETDKKEN